AVRRSAVRPARRRAASSSSVVRGPLSASHSATAASPDRTRRARRAAAVIHAETLTPSAAAASTTSAWTSGSTVMASLGDGLPRGINEVYHYGTTAGRCLCHDLIIRAGVPLARLIVPPGCRAQGR